MKIDEDQSTGAIPGLSQLLQNTGLPLTAADLFSKAAKSGIGLVNFIHYTAYEISTISYLRTLILPILQTDTESS